MAVVSVLLAGLAVPRFAVAEELVELEIKLPKAMFSGTPRNAKSTHLDPTTGQSRKPFRVPAGLTNVVAGKTVTASDDDPIVGELEMLTDGDKEGGDGSFTEFGPGLQWVQVDLGDVYELFAVLVWHFHSEAVIYHDVVVQLSDDPDFVAGVTTIYNNDVDNSAGLGVGKDWEWIETHEGRLMPAKGVAARYIRLYSNGSTSNDMNHYIEIEAYGRPAE
ncbi:MAG: hypothetical protein GWP08_11365 [Nitrospiraceae bacterium]|nr:hypothetical protein [Nitrospiraceae bacterium]